jgi:hypothetical protein
MQEAKLIRILENDNNRRGDLFGRLMADLFVALGYGQPRLNIHKSGRELDLSATHRLEPRRAIAECKATAETIGGRDLNTFVGVLDAEQEDQQPITGYFISLSGFRETAVEQEKNRRRKIITLTGAQVISELVRGRSIISSAQATERAGRHCASLDHLELDSEAELVAHERGWIWIIYYTQGKARTDFILIHSDGTPLARGIAVEVIESDRECGGFLHTLSCLNPFPPAELFGPRVEAALAAYRQYLENECGYILLDGLPADTDVGSRRIRLESLFVPLHLEVPSEEQERQTAGTLIAKYSRLALLAPPGGGKSTLLKRLAVAYADPARQEHIADDLPKRDWLPLFFRCRELRGLARGSFAELIEAISQRDPVRQYEEVFRAYVERALRNGRVLLLVDGLDEITDPGDRAAFVCTLRTSLQAYQDNALVITSREAGFRHVAAHLAPVCTLTTLSPFDSDDIRRLCVAWHQEVVGDTEKVRADAEQLADVITRNDRIRGLAMNPLLLTTLLLVKRWVGSLPTRRSILYGKAVEVLLMTWNTEGHDPIPDVEALPQLCYVASAMMLEGVQKISRRRLAALLQQAREDLPTELGYVKGTVDEFIHRVEDRSSLLMMSGLDVEDGRLVEFFEFRHLTFQEFLTARGMVEGWHPHSNETDTLVGVLEPLLAEEQWREVIPLAAVLGGKAAEDLIRYLTVKLDQELSEHSHQSTPELIALVNCLTDEAAARPETIRAAMRAIARRGTYVQRDTIEILCRGRYGAELRAEASKIFLTDREYHGAAGDLLVGAVIWQTLESEDNASYKHAANRFAEMLNSSEELIRCEGALGIGWLFHERQYGFLASLKLCSESLPHIGQMLLAMIDGTAAECCSALYAIEGLVTSGVWTPPAESDIHGRLYRLWQGSTDRSILNLTVRAFIAQPLVPHAPGSPHPSFPQAEIKQLAQDSVVQFSSNEGLFRLIIVWYAQVLDDLELASRAQAFAEKYSGHRSPSLNKFLKHLGIPT